MLEYFMQPSLEPVLHDGLLIFSVERSYVQPCFCLANYTLRIAFIALRVLSSHATTTGTRPSTSFNNSINLFATRRRSTVTLAHKLKLCSNL